ncbi:MAG TPA: sensor histidine kinase, partial [Pyrinomonadaceae bacterium]|nr:sensor histidine kinase [Pyrinomonadaceae bacterium]
DQINGMAARILKLQDDERRRIALALHDDTGQELSVLSINLSALKKRFDPDSVESEEISKCQIHLDKVLKELRTLSYLLHPPMLDDAGLISALRWFVDGFSRRSDIEVSLKLDESIGRLPTEVETALYRVVQEALTNVHRHSSAKTASVSLDGNAREIILRITDRGKGMPVESGRDRPSDVTSIGVGIMGMRQRLAQLGGTLEIRSNARGTTVIASVPRRIEL